VIDLVAPLLSPTSNPEVSVRHLTLKLAVCGFVGVLVLPDWATAQPPRRPVGNPYLSLTGSPSSVAGAYYGIVRPQLDLRNNLQRLQGQVTRVETEVTVPGVQALPPTGQLATFMNHSGYFLNSGAYLGSPTRLRGGPITQRPPR
jgi:hypothetical protein